MSSAACGVEPGERVERARHHVGHEFADVLEFAIAVRGAVRVRQPRRRMPELLGLVADALEVGDGLDDGDDQPQVRRRGRTRGEHPAAVLVDRDFHRVDLVVEPGDFLAQPAVAVDDGADAVLQLLLHQPAHLQDAGADAFEFRVVAAVDVVRKVRSVHHVPESPEADVLYLTAGIAASSPGRAKKDPPRALARGIGRGGPCRSRGGSGVAAASELVVQVHLQAVVVEFDNRRLLLRVFMK